MNKVKNTTQTTKKYEQHSVIPQKAGNEPMCSPSVSSSCFIPFIALWVCGWFYDNMYSHGISTILHLHFLKASRWVHSLLFVGSQNVARIFWLSALCFCLCSSTVLLCPIFPVSRECPQGLVTVVSRGIKKIVTNPCGLYGPFNAPSSSSSNKYRTALWHIHRALSLST
jgi:hypothetical protein